MTPRSSNRKQPVKRPTSRRLVEIVVEEALAACHEARHARAVHRATPCSSNAVPIRSAA